jgi:hypothetical protein
VLVVVVPAALIVVPGFVLLFVLDQKELLREEGVDDEPVVEPPLCVTEHRQGRYSSTPAKHSNGRDDDRGVRRSADAPRASETLPDMQAVTGTTPAGARAEADMLSARIPAAELWLTHKQSRESNLTAAVTASQ